MPSTPGSSNDQPLLGRSALPSRRVAGTSLNREQLLEEVFLTLEGSLSGQLEQSISREVSEEFAAFFETLDAPVARQQMLTEALETAYSEIHLLAAAMERGEISEEDASSLQNPNHVLDSLAPLLDSDELTLLETTLESRARSDFDLASVSQLELEIPELGDADRRLVLDTLFYETYALTSPDGLAMGGVVDKLESQLRALDNAYFSLSGSLPEQEMAAVAAFLEEKRRALAAAAIHSSGIC
ncbi:MAG: hypothetical protein O2948_05020 [Proteobacteria bacterium]|nr:hypothetical protein [Pseudomonadota bacterium]MDA0927558.1 hypothetical protein [Pseudomonadota bacterium]